MILVFSGTSDGQELCSRLKQEGVVFTAAAATEYGRGKIEGQYLASNKALDKNDIIKLVKGKGVDAIIDAAHPFAEKLHSNIIEVSAECGVRVLRLEREPTTFPDYSKLTFVDSYEEAANTTGELLKNIEGKALLSTGSKTLAVFAKVIEHSRICVRVLPQSKVISECENIGLSADNIIAMKGPFSEEENEAHIKRFNISVIVSKDSGAYGGLDEKVKAAVKSGIFIVVIKRPRFDFGETFYDIQNLVDAVKF